jgi:sec-independent protein translocase protein TatA
MDEPWVWALIIVAGLVLFGSKRMPDAARGLGRSLRIFKAETKGLMGDDENTVAPAAVAAPEPVYAQAVPAPAPVVVQAPVPAPPPVVVAPVATAPVVPPVVQQPDAQ